MTTISQIRGMLLEETLLYHWQASGFKVLVDDQTDSTLNTGLAGLEVVGRSELHPVGGVAENSVTAPFSLPIRLLLEAKLYADNKAVEIGPLQRIAGLRRDIEEGWMVTSSATPPDAAIIMNLLSPLPLASVKARNDLPLVNISIYYTWAKSPN